METIIQDAQNNCPGFQSHVIFLGGNNLRDNFESVESFIEKCATLVKSFRDIPNSNLVFVSLIPSPRTHHKCRTTFQESNVRLEKLALEHPLHASFLDVNDIFFNHGKINYQLFSDDRIHLVESGTRKVAHAISCHLKKIACE